MPKRSNIGNFDKQNLKVNSAIEWRSIYTNIYYIIWQLYYHISISICTTYEYPLCNIIFHQGYISIFNIFIISTNSFIISTMTSIHRLLNTIKLNSHIIYLRPQRNSPMDNWTIKHLNCGEAVPRKNNNKVKNYCWRTAL